MSTLVIIPARGNSKGILRKNLQIVGGKPLITWTIEAAKAAASINRIVVTTEDKEIADIALACGAEVPFVRPQKLAGDNIHTARVVAHTLEWLGKHENYHPDVVVMLLATAPLRTAQHIDEAVVLHKSSRCPVIGVRECSLNIHRLRTTRNGNLCPVAEHPPETQRQDVESIYYINGCIHISSFNDFMRSKTFHTASAIPYIMSRKSSVDIDGQEDIDLANRLLIKENVH